MIVGGGTIFSVVSWVVVTFLGDPHREIPDPENVNETMTVEIAQLMIDSWYPWDAKHGMAFFFSFIYQVSKSNK